MNPTNNQFAAVLERQNRNQILDTLFALMVACCLLVSIAGLSSAARASSLSPSTVPAADITVTAEAAGSFAGELG